MFLRARQLLLSRRFDSRSITMATSSKPDSSRAAFPPLMMKSREDASRTLCCAHRGYRAKYPENTILAFEEAVKAGAHALETDVHLTSDGVVVLSHDLNLRRCFGRDDKILDTTWKEICELRTLAPPHVPMPQLGDLLELLKRPECKNIWVILDIKLDNNPDDIMRLIASTIESTPPSPGQPWNERIILGIWSKEHYPLALKYSPSFPIMHIGMSLPYARKFFKMPQVGFNMLLPMLMAPGGERFITDCQKKYHRPLVAWTVNDPERMRWCIQKGIDAIITDDPQTYFKVVDVMEEEDWLKDEDTTARIDPRVRLRLMLLWCGITFCTYTIGPVRMMNLRRRVWLALQDRGLLR